MLDLHPKAILWLLAGEEVLGQVTDSGDGWYAAAYRLTKAGKFTISLELAGAQVWKPEAMLDALMMPCSLQPSTCRCMKQSCRVESLQSCRA